MEPENSQLHAATVTPLTLDVELSGKINKRPFIKVKHNADAEKIANSILQAWDLPSPSLIISITGGAMDFNLKKEDCTKVRRGLRKLMGAEGTWIISGGTNCGIMKLCGEAAQKHKYDRVEGFKPLIGIATWGAFPELENLHPGGNDNFRIKKGVGLDPNHTHFIFVDDGSGDTKFGKEQEFRGKLEKALSQQVPIVSIVVQGGPGTLKTVRYALENGTSCAVIKGTDGAADTIARLTSIRETDRDEKIHRKSRKIVNNSEAQTDESETTETLKSIWENRARVKVITLEDGDKGYVGNIDTAIMEILNGKGSAHKKSHSKKMQLELAFRWNRDDMLERILRRSKWNGNDKSEKLFRKRKEDEGTEGEGLRDTIHEIYLKSLQNSSIDFVRILSDFVDLNDFLSWFKEKKERPLHYLFIEEPKPSAEHTRTLPSLKMDNNVSDPNLKLFLYSTAHGRLETSEVFWKRLETGRIAAALFGGKIAKERLGDKTNTVEQRQLKAIHSFYEASAVELLTICHKSNASNTEELLKKPNLEFNGLSCLKLAERAKMRKFIAQSACQDLNDRKWRDGDDVTAELTPKQAWFLNVLSSLVFVFLFSWMCIRNLSSEISWLEGTVWLFVFTHTTEELRQFASLPEPSIRDKIKSYYEQSRWNVADTLAQLLVICAFVLRFWNSDFRQAAHVLYVASLQIYFIRLTSIFSLSSYLGPKLVMILKMLEDLGKFFVFALVYIIGYGVTVKALVFPGFDHPVMSFFWSILFRPYFEMLGDPDLEGIGAAHLDDCSETPWPYETCPVDKTAITAFAIFFKALFMFFTHVLLLNLLIAIFNNRYQQMERESETLWKYNMYIVVKEYEERPLLPPPFIIFAHFWLLASYLKNYWEERQEENGKEEEDTGLDFAKDNPKICDHNANDDTGNVESKELLDWEEYCFEEMLASRNKQKHDKLEERFARLENKITLHMKKRSESSAPEVPVRNLSLT